MEKRHSTGCRSRSELGTLLLYLLLAMVVTWPMALHISDGVPGVEEGDIWDHLWSMDWTRRAIVEPGVTLFFNPWAYIPEGLLLFPMNLVNELLSVPLQLLFGTIAAYNLMTIILLVFAAWAAFRLALHLTDNHAAALVAGTVFGFTPCILSSLPNGTPETLSAGWMPLYIWMLLRSAPRRDGPSLVVPAVILFMSAVSCWYYGAFNVMFTVLYVVSARGIETRENGPSAVKRGIGVLLLAVFLIAVPAVIFRASLDFSDARYLQTKADFINRTLQHPTFSASPGSLLSVTGRRNVEGFAHYTFLGWIPLLAALGGLVAGEGSLRRRMWWGAVAIFFAVMSLGPALWTAGRPRVLLPYYLAMKFVPLFHCLEFPFRFAALVSLALAVLTALGVTRLLRERGALTRATLAFVLVVFIIVEYISAVSWPQPFESTRIPEAYRQLADREERGAVIEFPLGFDFKGRYFYHQMAHKRPIPVGINTVVSDDVCRILLGGPTDMITYWPVSELVPGQLENLRRTGIRYVVWHAYDDPRHLQLKAALHAQGLTAIHEDNDMTVFDLGPAGPARAHPKRN